MSSPPACFQISSWDNGPFAPALFPVGSWVGTNPDSTPGLYDLTWKNGNDKDRLMGLPWTSNPDGGGDFSGTKVTVYELSDTGTATQLMTVDVIITIDEKGACNGTLVLTEQQPPVLAEKRPPLTPTPGIFVAQADPGTAGSYA